MKAVVLPCSRLVCFNYRCPRSNGRRTLADFAVLLDRLPRRTTPRSASEAPIAISAATANRRPLLARSRRRGGSSISSNRLLVDGFPRLRWRTDLPVSPHQAEPALACCLRIDPDRRLPAVWNLDFYTIDSIALFRVRIKHGMGGLQSVTLLNRFGALAPLRRGFEMKRSSANRLPQSAVCMFLDLQAELSQ